MNEYGFMVKWKWRGKTDAFGMKPSTVPHFLPCIPHGWTGTEQKTQGLCNIDSVQRNIAKGLQLKSKCYSLKKRHICKTYMGEGSEDPPFSLTTPNESRSNS